MKGEEIVKIMTSPAITIAVATICIVVLIRVGMTTYMEFQHYQLQQQ